MRTVKKASSGAYMTETSELNKIKEGFSQRTYKLLRLTAVLNLNDELVSNLKSEVHRQLQNSQTMDRFASKMVLSDFMAMWFFAASSTKQGVGG